jgi:DNA polymerase-1
MVKIDRSLTGKKSKLLLQVHDELVLEAPPEEIEEIKHLVRSEMENVIQLNVPLVVDVGTGDNWRDAK